MSPISNYGNIQFFHLIGLFKREKEPEASDFFFQVTKYEANLKMKIFAY